MNTQAQQAENDSLYMRQLGIFNPSDHPTAHVTFVGVGGIGSFAAFAAGKLGIPSITLIDPDTVEKHNQPNQMYDSGDVGVPKVEALNGWMDERATFDNVAADKDTTYKQGVVVSGLDSMAARSEVWQGIKMNPSIERYIDARIAGQLILIYSFVPYDPEACDKYEATLHSDDEAEPASCTARGIIDVGFAVGSLITRQLRQHYAREAIEPVTYINHETLSVSKGDWWL